MRQDNSSWKDQITAVHDCAPSAVQVKQTIQLVVANNFITEAASHIFQTSKAQPGYDHIAVAEGGRDWQWLVLPAMSHQGQIQHTPLPAQLHSWPWPSSPPPELQGHIATWLSINNTTSRTRCSTSSTSNTGSSNTSTRKTCHTGASMSQGKADWQAPAGCAGTLCRRMYTPTCTVWVPAA